MKLLRQHVLRSLFSALGGATAIGLALALAGPGMSPFLLASLGASAVILFVFTDTPAAQPRALVAGHLIAAFIGILCQHWLGDALWVYAVALGLSLAVMLVCRCVHPPAGADALIMIHQHATLSMLVQPVLVGVLALAFVACLWSRLLGSHKRYPVAWNMPSPPATEWSSWHA